MDVSIIIVNWNTRELLRDCIRSICEQDGSDRFEIIVIDNRSTDGSGAMVKEEFPGAILVENSVNRGFAAANNQGIALARGRYILLLNSDTTVCDNAIEKTVQYADKHPEAAVVGCQVWENSETVQMTCFRFPSLINLLLDAFALNRIFKANRFFGREWMQWWPRDSEREVDVVSGMFMLVRKKAIAEVGLMDEAFFIYCEEADWCYRFTKAGWKVLFWPGAKIIHVDGGSHSTNKNAVGMSVQFQKSLLIFFKKHYGSLSYFAARSLLTLSLGLRCCFWTFMAVLKRMLTNKMDYKAEKRKKCWSAFKFCVFGSEP